MLSSTARPNPIREGRKPVIPSEWGRGVSAASSERFEGHRQPILRARDRPHLPGGRIAVGYPDAVGSQHMVEEALRLLICEMQTKAPVCAHSAGQRSIFVPALPLPGATYPTGDCTGSGA